MRTLDIDASRDLLPHRYPFLLVDRIIEMDEVHIVGIKNVSLNEPFFLGHFPDFPVMPGVMIIEAMAQTGCLLTHLSYLVEADGKPQEDKLCYLVKIDNAKFSKMVVPGDRLELEVVLKRLIRNMAMYSGIARVDGVQVACAEILCAEVKN